MVGRNRSAVHGPIDHARNAVSLPRQGDAHAALGIYLQADVSFVRLRRAASLQGGLTSNS